MGLPPLLFRGDCSEGLLDERLLARALPRISMFLRALIAAEAMLSKFLCQMEMSG